MKVCKSLLTGCLCLAGWLAGAAEVYLMDGIEIDDPRFVNALAAVNADQVRAGRAAMEPGEFVRRLRAGENFAVVARPAGGRPAVYQVAWSRALLVDAGGGAAEEDEEPGREWVTGRTYTVAEVLAAKFSLDGKIVRLVVEAKNSNSDPEEVAAGVYRAFVAGDGGYDYVTFSGAAALDAYRRAQKTSRSSKNFYAVVHARHAIPIELVGLRRDGNKPVW